MSNDDLRFIFTEVPSYAHDKFNEILSRRIPKAKRGTKRKGDTYIYI